MTFRLLGALLLAIPLHAQTLQWRVVPVAPTNLTPVVIAFSGVDEFPPVSPRVRIDGATIHVEFGRAFNVPREWREQVQLGALPPGNYEVVVTKEGDPPQRFPLRVRDATTFPILTPIAVGEVEIDVMTRYPTRVFLGTRLARFTHANRGGIVVTPNAPIAPGLYDLTFEYFDGRKETARNAVEFVERDEGQPFGERQLMPVWFNGPGADGTQWRSEFDIADERRARMIREFEDEPHPRGLFWRIPPHRLLNLRYAVRVREAKSDRPSAVVPFIPERAFRISVWVPAVPTGPGQRATLRVYSLEPAEVTVLVGGQRRLVTTTRARLTEPAFASIDISNFQGEQDVFVQSVEPVWALASTYDAVTGDLTIRMPIH